MKKRSVQRGMLVKEGGSALLYLLFLIAFVGIVGAVMLTTVTQGQRNIVKSKAEQTQFYRAEGVIEIALKTMEEYEKEVVYEPPVEPEEVENPENPENPEELAEPEIIVEAGVYFYIKNVLNSPKTYTYPIDGQDKVIIGERLEINEHTAKAKLYDPLHPDTYRIITANYDGDNEAPGPDPDPDPEYPPVEDPGFAYIDKNHNWKYDPDKDEKVSIGTLVVGEVKTKDILVIPSSVGQITSTNAVEYSADKGLFLGADLKSKSTQSIELKTKYGKLIIAKDVTIASSAKLEIKTEKNSEILINHASLTTSSSGSIDVSSQGLLTIHQSTISSSSGIIAYSKKDLNITSSDFSSNGTIELKTDKALTMKQATLNSSGKITVNARQYINSDHASLSSNGDIQIEAKDNISVQEAELQAAENIYFISSHKKNTINITKASLLDRNDNLAEAGPNGVNILGTPITGCITNGEQKICSAP